MPKVEGNQSVPKEMQVNSRARDLLRSSLNIGEHSDDFKETKDSEGCLNQNTNYCLMAVKFGIMH